MILKICQVCQLALSDSDISVDPYVHICQNCWKKWEQESGEPMRRYGTASGKTICTACGMVFGGLKGFEIHRKGMRCNPPNFMVRRGYFLKDGIWIHKLPSEMPKFHALSAKYGVFTEKPTQGHPDR